MESEKNNTAEIITSRTQSPTLSTTVTLIVTVTALLIAVAGVSFYIWYGMVHTPAMSDEAPDTTAVAEEQLATSTALSPEEKMNTVRSLEMNPNNLSPAEKRAILESL